MDYQGLDQPTSCCSPKTKKFRVFVGVAITFGVLLITAAIVLPIIINNQIDQNVNSAIVLSEANKNNDEFKAFANTNSPNAPPVLYKMHLYNIMNARDMLNGDPPVVEEVGPYVFNEYKIRFNFTWANSTIRFKTCTYYIMNESLTTVSLDRPITTLNIPYQAVKGQLEESDKTSFFILSELVKDDYTRLFTTRTARELLWGYKDNTLLPMAHIADPSVSTRFPGLMTNCTDLDMADKTTKYDTMMTGEDDVSNVRKYVEWQEMKSIDVLNAKGKMVPAWGSPEANKVQGTDAEQFQRNPPKDASLEVLLDVAFRTGHLNYTETKSFRGIDLQYYEIARSELMNTTANPSNSAYYAFGATGLLNLSSCSQGMKVFMSKPHFLDLEASDMTHIYYTTQPDRDLHDTFVGVEPITGITMHAAKRLQANFYIESVSLFKNLIRWFPKLKASYVPVFWAEEGGMIDENNASKFKDQLYGALAAKKGVQLGGYIGGGCLLLIGISMLAFAKWGKSA